MIRTTTLFCLGLLPASIIAEPQINETFWEVGAGFTTLNLPLYPGSSQDRNLLIPFPFFRIQSKYFEIDQGIKGFFFESPDIRLNVSADLGIPVNSEDSNIRNGMPNLKTVIQFGPSVEIIFAGGRRQPSEFRLELPLRAAISTDLKNNEHIGWVAEPRLTYETLRPFKTGFSFQVQTGLRYATQDYHQYYYDVAPEFATSFRPAFESDAGYSGYFLDLSTNWRSGNILYFAFGRYQNMKQTEYELSPLVEQTDYLSFGIGMVWIFADSL